MKHNASKCTGEAKEFFAELSSEDLRCSIKQYPQTKVFDMKLGSYKLSSPKGLLAESAASDDSLVGVFCYKPFDEKVDWSMVAKVSPCYMTYLKESIDQVLNFFESNNVVSQIIVRETAAAVQMTIDEVKRTAQQQMNRALKDHARFSLDLDIATPKIMIPADFRPDNTHITKLLLDLGNLVIRTQDDCQQGCGVILHLQQIQLETPYYQSTRLAIRLPSLGFYFSPACYHRLMTFLLGFFASVGNNGSVNSPGCLEYIYMVKDKEIEHLEEDLSPSILQPKLVFLYMERY
ncbi:hypothetical protein K1719_014716 [Acacia pycnantha]|nr:hypothetical protein K1719_014716 [Acacia pycnantha]